MSYLIPGSAVGSIVYWFVSDPVGDVPVVEASDRVPGGGVFSIRPDTCEVVVEFGRDSCGRLALTVAVEVSGPRVTADGGEWSEVRGVGCWMDGVSALGVEMPGWVDEFSRRCRAQVRSELVHGLR